MGGFQHLPVDPRQSTSTKEPGIRWVYGFKSLEPLVTSYSGNWMPWVYLEIRVLHVNLPPDTREAVSGKVIAKLGVHLTETGQKQHE